MSLELGKKLLSQKNFKAAEKIFLELKKTNNNLELNYNLGVVNFELRDLKKSLRFFEKCLKINQNSINTYLKIAFLEQSTGNIKGSFSNYLQAININKRDIRAYYGIYTLDPNLLTKNHYEQIKNINDNPKLNKLERSLSEFLLSKKEKQEKNFDKEIYFLKNSHQFCFDFSKKYNLESQKYYFKIINKLYNQPNYINFEKKDNYLNNISPIFIVGLPRSGSTLVESILTSSEENIPSFGESAFINMGLITQLSSYLLSDNENFEKFDFNVEEFENFIHKKYTQFSIINKNTNFFVDKSLENFFNIEFILKIFPKAKFIHTHRNLKDAIIAIHQSLLPKLSWTHSIDDIIKYADNYQKIIKYFKKKYPQKIIDMSLEDLTLNKERVTKEIFQFCNLSWKPQVLEFYNRKNLDIRTTSNIQIRNKITTYDQYKYSKYFYLFKEYQNKLNWLK